MPAPETSLPIPSDWAAITPAWMTRALAPHFPGCRVREVRIELRDDGTNRRARLALAYEEGVAGPATVFLKGADPKHARLIAATSGLFDETRLFASGLSLPVDCPKAFAALIDEPGMDFLLVLEDVVARGADPRDSTRPLSVDQAANGLRALARLHGRFSGARSEGDPQLAWLTAYQIWTGLGRGVVMALDRLGERVPAPVRRLGKALADEHWLRFAHTLSTGAQTLVHGDAHIGNTYVLPDDEVGFLDWQVVSRSNAALDVGYFLQGALPIAECRAHERDLIADYHAHLDLPAGAGPSFDEVWLRYRGSAVHGLATWLATASDGGVWQRLEVSEALVDRYAAAFVDLETEAALDALAGRG